MVMNLRYGGVVAGDDEITAATAVMRSQGWACGPVTRDLETALAAYMGLPHAVLVNSGTSGLLAAMRCLPAGSGVVMPALQFPTLYSAAVWCGLRPVLADISLDTLNMTGETPGEGPRRDRTPRLWRSCMSPGTPPASRMSPRCARSGG